MTAQAAGLQPSDENPFYVQAMAALALEQAVVAQDDIYGSNGIKLVAKGSQVSQAQFERLAQHKLKVPLDQVLASARPTDAASLAIAAGQILQRDAIYCRLANRSGDALAIKHTLAALDLPRPLLLRLTVMRDQRHEMFEHSLRTAIIAEALAVRLRLGAGDRQLLAIAALCHDIGEMHTDPLLLAADHDITPEERRFIHVHPLTGYVLLQNMPSVPAPAAQAVLQHHERLDGSGYPYGLRSDKIAPLAKLIAVADVAETVIRRFNLPRLDMLARLHHGRFEQSAVDALRDLIHVTPDDAILPLHGRGAGLHLSRLADMLQAWATLRDVFERQVAPKPPEASPLAFLFERMLAIRQLVLQAGIDPDHVDQVMALARDDPGILLELRTMLDEMEWLQLDLANEIDRRSPALGALADGPLQALKQQLRPSVTESIPPELLAVAPEDDPEVSALPPRHG